MNFRIRVFKNTAGELHYLVAPEASTDRIIYGELLAAAKVTWKPGGPDMYVRALLLLKIRELQR